MDTAWVLRSAFRLAPNGLRKRARTVAASLTFRYEGLEAIQFVRYCAYLDIRRLIASTGLQPRDVLEVGRSNGVIASYLNPVTHTVTGDYPAVDVSDMPQFADDSYDVVVVDQVLEHVRAPARAAAEIRRVLRPGGYAIVATPFLIRIHGDPDDYWRFTREGLKELFKDFSDVQTGQWGNRFTLRVIMRHGWLSSRVTRRRLLIDLTNEPEWPIVVWALCRK